MGQVAGDAGTVSDAPIMALCTIWPGWFVGGTSCRALGQLGYLLPFSGLLTFDVLVSKNAGVM